MGRNVGTEEEEIGVMTVIERRAVDDRDLATL